MVIAECIKSKEEFLRYNDIEIFKKYYNEKKKSIENDLKEISRKIEDGSNRKKDIYNIIDDLNQTLEKLEIQINNSNNTKTFFHIYDLYTEQSHLECSKCKAICVSKIKHNTNTIHSDSDVKSKTLEFVNIVGEIKNDIKNLSDLKEIFVKKQNELHILETEYNEKENIELDPFAGHSISAARAMCGTCASFIA